MANNIEICYRIANNGYHIIPAIPMQKKVTIRWGVQYQWYNYYSAFSNSP